MLHAQNYHQIYKVHLILSDEFNLLPGDDFLVHPEVANEISTFYW